MRNDPIPNPRFIGIFIPVEILDLPELNSTDIIMLSWIDALDDPKNSHSGCFASNKYLADRLKLQENTVNKIISKLKDLGLIRQVSFDGRIRVLTCCKENWFKKESIESQSACDSNHTQDNQPVIKITVCPGKESFPPIYSKEEIKDKTHKGVCVLDSFGSHVKLEKKAYEKLTNDHGKPLIDQMIIEMNDYCAASFPKGYNDYAAALRQWINRKKQPQQAKYANPKDAIRAKQLNEYEETNGSFDDCVVKF